MQEHIVKNVSNISLFKLKRKIKLIYYFKIRKSIIDIAVTNHGVTREDGVVNRDYVHEINISREDTLFVSFIFLSIS